MLSVFDLFVVSFQYIYFVEPADYLNAMIIMTVVFCPVHRENIYSHYFSQHSNFLPVLNAQQLRKFSNLENLTAAVIIILD